ncbi:MAG TPA: RidA family protein [Candidatus Acidoferrales bacterium]|nr:RidA family protein [Candidatus Acidoferrales bacterium]
MKTVQPEGWPRPSGYSNGLIARGRVLAVAGQIGWNERGEFSSDDLVEQSAQALRNVLAVVHAAGGSATDVIRLTWYITDKDAYRAAAAQLGRVYRELFGAHYPAMTLVQVAALLEDRARVEIEATAVLADD